MAQRHRTLTLAALTATALLTMGCQAGSGSGSTPEATSATTTTLHGSSASGPAHGSAPSRYPSLSPSRLPLSPSPRPPSASPASAAPAPARRPATPWCTTGQLKVSVRALQPGAGQRYAAVVLTNTSGTACRTRGWVGMQLMGAKGGKVPTLVVRDDSRPPALVRLAAGGSAWARLHWTVVPTGREPDTGACQPTADRALITPPDQHTQLTAPWTLGPVCASGRIDTLPLAPGTGPS